MEISLLDLTCLTLAILSKVEEERLGGKEEERGCEESGTGCEVLEENTPLKKKNQGFKGDYAQLDKPLWVHLVIHCVSIRFQPPGLFRQS